MWRVRKKRRIRKRKGTKRKKKRIAKTDMEDKEEDE